MTTQKKRKKIIVDCKGLDRTEIMLNSFDDSKEELVIKNPGKNGTVVILQVGALKLRNSSSVGIKVNRLKK